MEIITLTCDMCSASKTFDQRELGELLVALQQGNAEALRCLTCGISLVRPPERAVKLLRAIQRLPTEIRTRRRHLRLPFDLQASFWTPGGRGSRGRVKNLSDGGLCLLTVEILPPATHLRVDLHTRQRVHTFEGEVVWNDAERRSNVPPITHGIRFTAPLAQGLAVELFLIELAQQLDLTPDREVSTMDNFYRKFIPTALWLGVAAFALAVFLMVFSLPFPFRLTPGGIVHDGEALLLIAVAGYCTHRTAQRHEVR